MIRFFLLFFFFISATVLSAQELVPYYDRDKGKWGFQDAITRKVVIQPQYDHASEWWNGYGIVAMEGKYGLIDKSGNKASPFILDYIFVGDCAECETKKMLASEVRYAEEYTDATRTFFINEKCDCVPQPYYPCPPMVKMDTSETKENLVLLQRAESYYHRGNIKKALDAADKAIDTDTSDASAYFWKAMHLGDHLDLNIMEEPVVLHYYNDEARAEWEKIYREESDIWEKRLASAKNDRITRETYDAEMKILNDENEAMLKKFNKRTNEIDSLDRYYTEWREQGLDYINTKYDTSFHLVDYYDAVLQKTNSCQIYYSTLAAKMELNYISKEERKKIEREIISNVPRSYRKSSTAIMISGGLAIFPYQKWEANLTYGASDFMFDNFFPAFLQAGLGYEKAIEMQLDSYKAILMAQLVGPLHAAMNFLFLNGNTGRGFGFRPEFGFSFSAVTILYGFNFVSSSKFPDVRGNMVGARLHLPLWRSSYFGKEWGSNLFR